MVRHECDSVRGWNPGADRDATRTLETVALMQRVQAATKVGAECTTEQGGRAADQDDVARTSGEFTTGARRGGVALRPVDHRDRGPGTTPCPAGLARSLVLGQFEQVRRFDLASAMEVAARVVHTGLDGLFVDSSRRGLIPLP